MGDALANLALKNPVNARHFNSGRFPFGADCDSGDCLAANGCLAGQGRVLRQLKPNDTPGMSVSATSVCGDNAGAAADKMATCAVNNVTM